MKFVEFTATTSVEIWCEDDGGQMVSRAPPEGITDLDSLVHQEIAFLGNDGDSQCCLAEDQETFFGEVRDNDYIAHGTCTEVVASLEGKLANGSTYHLGRYWSVDQAMVAMDVIKEAQGGIP